MNSPQKPVERFIQCFDDPVFRLGHYFQARSYIFNSLMVITVYADSVSTETIVTCYSYILSGISLITAVFW